MQRREFLEIAGVGAVSLRRTAGSPAHGVTQAGTARATRSPSELQEQTIRQLQEAMSEGRLTARAIVEHYLQRIESVDHRGPSLRSVIEVNPDALSAAEALDRERKAGKLRGPLHGIPLIVKDNIDTADRMKTSAGSMALIEWTPPRDAFIVERLRAAGAIVLAKANLSEWANFRSEQSTSGWSARGGLTRNPYVLDRNPCGSSSGSGVAVAADLCAGAVGTETDGSIVCPSSANGCVGLKPTVGLLSRSGIIPIAASQDTAGPMTRTVADAAALLSAMTGMDPRDRATSRSRGRGAADYTTFLDPAGLKGARIGVMRNFFGFHEGVDRTLDAALAELKSAGAVLVDPANLTTKGKFSDAEFQVLLYEFKEYLNGYLAGAQARIQSLADLIAFNDANRETELRWFGQDIFLESQKKGPLTSPAYLKARAACVQLSRTQGIDALMTRHRLDALVAPTGGPAWVTDLVNGDHFGGGSSSPAAVAGYPNVTVPAGFVHELPIGLSFIGRPWSEPTLIRLAYAFEQVTRARRPPKFIETVGGD